MLGGTTKTGIFLLNLFGLTLGGLFLFKKITKKFIYVNVPVVPIIEFRWRDWFSIETWLVFFILYVTVSVFNYKSIAEYQIDPVDSLALNVEFIQRESINFLPVTYGLTQTKFALVKYISVASIFLASRDWFLGGQAKGLSESILINNKRVLYYIFSIGVSSSILSLVGVIQYLDGTDKLLWVYTNHINGGEGAFGPFPYRSNAAQYLNLIWPIMLGYWFETKAYKRRTRMRKDRLGSDKNILLLLMASVIVLGIFVAKSRGGLIVFIVLLIVSLFFGLWRLWGNVQSMLLILALPIVVSIVGWIIGGAAIMRRLSTDGITSLTGRDKIYEVGNRMVGDFIIFGSGAETFAPLYFIYRKSLSDPWCAYAHNDYLETLITFGIIGSGILLIIFVLILLTPLKCDSKLSSAVDLLVFLSISIFGILLAARFDLPMQIYSILIQVAVILSLFTSVTWRVRPN
jgi:hypothetical protein